MHKEAAFIFIRLQISLFTKGTVHRVLKAQLGLSVSLKNLPKCYSLPR